MSFNQLNTHQPMKNDQDELLVELRDTIDPIMTKIQDDPASDRAVFVLSAKEHFDKNGESDGTVTFLDVVGDLGLIQEGIYGELVEMINEGKPEIFQALREVIREIEEDLDLPDEPLESPMVSRLLH